MNYTKVNQDGKRSSYYPDLQKKYKEKINRCEVIFSLKDKELFDFLQREAEQNGLSKQNYIKRLLFEKMESNKTK